MRHATWCRSFRRTVTLSSPILRQQTLTRKSRRNGSAKFGKHLEILPLTLGAKTVSGRIDCTQTMCRDATRATALTVATLAVMALAQAACFIEHPPQRGDEQIDAALQANSLAKLADLND